MAILPSNFVSHDDLGGFGEVTKKEAVVEKRNEIYTFVH